VRSRSGAATVAAARLYAIGAQAPAPGCVRPLASKEAIVKRGRKAPAGSSRRRAPVAKPGRKPRAARSASVDAVPVTAAELRALQREIERRMSAPTTRPVAGIARGRGRKREAPAPLRWNPDPEDVQKSVAQLVLTIVEFLRRLMERQAIRRMDAKTLTDAEVEAVGQALMRLEDTVREIAARFGLTPEDLNLDLGPVKLV
jgi:hypothetical protein